MADKSDNPFKFWEELKRRKVIRVITVYAAASFVLLELVDIISEPFGLPDWTLRLVFVLLCIGFVIAVILSWVYDITPEGIQKTKQSGQNSNEAKQVASRGWKISTYISGLIIVAFVIFYIISNIKQSSDITKLEKSIAVLPFDNESSDEENEYFVNGMMEDIRNNLSMIGDLQVLSKTSAEKYRNSDQSIKEIAKELDVNFLLEGTVQKQGNQVKIHAQLIEATRDNHIWTHTYLKDISDVFKVQSEVAQTIASELRMVLSPEEIEQINNQPTDNLEAYNLYLRGRFYWHRRTEEDLNMSINYFNQALKLDTNYALAYAGLADAYFILTWWGWYPQNDGYNRSKEFALKALSINNNISEAHATLGGIATFHEWDWKQAEKEIKQSISLNSSFGTAHQYYSELLDILGRNKEAREQINLALKFNPNSYMMNAFSALCYYHNAEYEKSIEESNKAIDLAFSNTPLLEITLNVFKCYVNLDMEEEALQIMKTIISKNDLSNDYKLIDVIYDTSGIKGVIYWLIDWMINNRPEESYNTASLYAIIGDSQKAIECLEKTDEMGDMNITFINNNPDFSNLKIESRFQSLLKKMNLE